MIDDPTLDTGGRLVLLDQRVGAALALADAAIAAYPDDEDTHYEDCHLDHASCLAHRIRRQLTTTEETLMTTTDGCRTTTPHGAHTYDRRNWAFGWCPGVPAAEPAERIGDAPGGTSMRDAHDGAASGASQAGADAVRAVMGGMLTDGWRRPDEPERECSLGCPEHDPAEEIVAERITEPAGASGWDRATIERLIVQLYDSELHVGIGRPGDRGQLRALLADWDRLDKDGPLWARQRIQYLERKVNGLWADLNAARAELDRLREDARVRAKAVREQAVERDQAHARAHRLRTELAHHREVTREITAALPHADPTLPIEHAIREALVAVRRDGVADALHHAADDADAAAASVLAGRWRLLALKVRDGRSDVPTRGGGGCGG